MSVKKNGELMSLSAMVKMCFDCVHFFFFNDRHVTSHVTSRQRHNNNIRIFNMNRNPNLNIELETHLYLF